MADLENITVEELDGDDNDHKFSDIFELQGFIGRGAFGSVVKANKVGDERVLAVKVIQKKSVSENEIEKLKEEAYILAEMNHPNIVKFRDIQETESKLFIVMEFVKGGSLKDLIVKRRREGIKFSDIEASNVMKSILSAVAYMHNNNIVHRDLKPENILVGDPNDLSSMKIADFGLSANFCKDGFMQSTLNQKAGTLIYMAPEYVNSKIYSKPVDLWSCACIMYILLSGGLHPLYSTRDNTESYKMKLLNPKWEFKDFFTPLAIDLFAKMTKINPLERIIADDCLKHPWITRRNEEIPLTATELFKTFAIQTQLERIIKSMYIVAKMFNSSPIEVEYHEMALKLSKQHSSEYRDIKMRKKPKRIDDNLLSNLVGVMSRRGDTSDILSLKAEEPKLTKIMSTEHDPNSLNPMKKSSEPKVIKPAMKKSLTKRKTILLNAGQGNPLVTLEKMNSNESPGTKTSLPNEQSPPKEQKKISDDPKPSEQGMRSNIVEIQLEGMIEFPRKKTEDKPKRDIPVVQSFKPPEIAADSPKKNPVSNEFRIVSSKSPVDPKNDSKGSIQSSTKTEKSTNLKPENSIFSKQPDPKSTTVEPDSKVPAAFSTKKTPSEPVMKQVSSSKARLVEKSKMDPQRNNDSVNKTEPPLPTTITSPNTANTNSTQIKKTASASRPLSYAAPLARQEHMVVKKGDFFVYNFPEMKLPDDWSADPKMQAHNHQLSTPDLVRLSKNLIIKTNVEIDLGKNFGNHLPSIASAKTPQKISLTRTNFHVTKMNSGAARIYDMQPTSPPKIMTSPKKDPIDILLRGTSKIINERSPEEYERKQSRLMSITGGAGKTKK